MTEILTCIGLAILFLSAFTLLAAGIGFLIDWMLDRKPWVFFTFLGLIVLAITTAAIYQGRGYNRTRAKHPVEATEQK